MFFPRVPSRLLAFQVLTVLALGIPAGATADGTSDTGPIRGPVGNITGRVLGPCPNPDKRDPACIVENPFERARVGTRCEAHPWTRLRLDHVRIHHGFGGSGFGFAGNGCPNARFCASGGCVDHGIPFAEVAYCPDCRTVFAASVPLVLLHRLFR